MTLLKKAMAHSQELTLEYEDHNTRTYFETHGKPIGLFPGMLWVPGGTLRLPLVHVSMTGL